MDSQKFDSLVKSLASPSSRRRLLKGVGAVSAGGLLTALGRQTMSAAQCSNNRDPCGNKCCPQGKFCCKSGAAPRCASNGQRETLRETGRCE
jgi:hypothetical protein